MTDQPNRPALTAAARDAQAITKRVLSAIALIAGSLALTWLGGLAFALMLLGVGATMMWEWKRMVGVAPEADFHVSIVAFGAIVLTGLVAVTHPAAIFAPLALALAAILIFRPMLLGAGILYVVLPVAALIWIRADEPYGGLAIIFLFAVVWATDTFAMITGRIVGGPLLWKSVSPNKTWSGAVGGLIAASIVGAAMLVFGASTGVSTGDWAYGAILGAALSVCAQVGDLVESAVKRACRVKDTSGLIPGHGGVLDRMDGIVGAAVGASAVLLLVAPDHPARSLVTGG
ncbi:MAG: phosphatidate cytidylyltransferase [Pseudomonadota bacterium]